MTNAPALIVRHRRFTLVIAVLLAAMLTIAAIGISIEFYHAQAGVVFVLWPQLLTLLGACLVREAYDRWAASTACLTVSAEGLTLPGVAIRPIPWTAVKSVRGVCCSAAPELAAMPRHYMLFDVEAPETFGVVRPGAVLRNAAPLPPDAPLVTLDLSELDTSKEAILSAVRRFHPAAIADAEADRPEDAAPIANDASIHVPSLQELQLAVRRIHTQVSALVARRGEVWPAAVAEWNRMVPQVRARTQALIAAADATWCIAVANLRRHALSARDTAAMHAARATEVVRAAALGIRHRFDRSF